MNLLLSIVLLVQSITVQTFGSPTKPVSVIEARVTIKDFVGIVSRSSGVVVIFDRDSLSRRGVSLNHTFLNVNKQNVPAIDLLQWVVDEVSKTHPITMVKQNGIIIIQGK